MEDFHKDNLMRHCYGEDEISNDDSEQKDLEIDDNEEELILKA